MATRKPKDLSSSPNDFAAALDEWTQENPKGFDAPKEQKRAAKKAPEGELAAQLRERFGVEGPNRQERREGKKSSRSPVRAAAPIGTKPVATEPTAPTSADGRRQLTAQELMQEAFEAAGDPSHDPTAKYTGQGYAKALDVDVLDETAAGVVDEAIDRFDNLDGHTSEDVAFLQLMSGADVKPLDRDLDKLRTALDSRIKWHKEPVVQRAPSSERTKEELDAPTVSGAQRDLLRRARKQKLLPTLNLRHQRKYEALQQLHAFVLKEQQSRTRFIRVITGKGKQSKDGVAVIKPMVIEWCELEPGYSLVLGFAPETDQSGNYGILVLELRR